MPESLPTSPLRLAAAPPPPPASAPGWIDLKEAARRSGWDEGYLRRRCSDDNRCATWRSLGLARQDRPPEGGQLRWLVHESADPKLSPVKTAEQQSAAFDLRSLAAAHQVILLRRERCVLELERALGEATAGGRSREETVAATAAQLSARDGVPVSARSLYRWLQEYRATGLRGLVDERWRSVRPETPARDVDPFLQEVQRIYLEQAKRSMQLAYDGALREAKAAGWRACSYKTACRFLKRIPARTLALYRGGEEAYAAAAPCNARDYTSIDSNDVWVGDHHRLDVTCQLPPGPDGKPRYDRPWLTAWMDMRSRRIVGWSVYAGDPNADVILSTFKAGVELAGAPWRVYIDNGKDYDSFCLQGLTKKQRLGRDLAKRLRGGGVFGRLGVEVTHAQLYKPQSKTIERFFGTVAGRFSPLFETYCGRDPATKPENLPDKLAAGKAPTVADVAGAFADWLDADYHAKGHNGDGMNGRTPLEVFAAELKRKRVLPAALLEELTLERTPPLAVGRNGVRWQGMYYGRNHPLLIPREGDHAQKVILGVDQSNLNLVRVYDAGDGRWLCNVTANEKIPVLSRDKASVRRVMAAQQRERKVAKAYHRVRPRLAMTLTDRLHEDALQKRRAAEQAPPPDAGPSMVPVRSPLEDQLPAIREALERQPLQRAVGAESIDLLKAVADMDDRPIDRFVYHRREPEPDVFDILSDWSRQQGREEASDE